MFLPFSPEFLEICAVLSHFMKSAPITDQLKVVGCCSVCARNWQIGGIDQKRVGDLATHNNTNFCKVMIKNLKEI